MSLLFCGLDNTFATVTENLPDKATVVISLYAQTYKTKTIAKTPFAY